MKILVIGAHPDDAEMGLGGSIALFKKLGYEVLILDLSNGEPTPFGTVKERIAESKKSARILKAERKTMDLENRKILDTVENRIKLAEEIRLFIPDIVFAPWKEDSHPDHIQTHLLANASRFYAKFTKWDMKGKPYYPPVYLYYICSHLRKSFPINALIDISSTFKMKLRAIKQYKTQFFYNKKNSHIFEKIQAINKYYGFLANTEYAEPVIFQEPITINNLSFLT